jgi:hypothetical protein
VRNSSNFFTVPGRENSPAPGAPRPPIAPALDPATAKRAADAERRRRELEAKAAQRSILEVAVRAKEAQTVSNGPGGYHFVGEMGARPR